MIVNTMKKCTGDAGPEQSLVLFSYAWAPKWMVSELGRHFLTDILDLVYMCFA